MRPVSDAFLLNMAEVSAALVGLFLVGVFFFVETGFRRVEHSREIVAPYFRAGTTGSTALLVNEVVGTAAVAVIVLLPWILGGIDPTREDLAWGVLLSFATGFLSIGAIVLWAFDLAGSEAAD